MYFLRVAWAASCSGLLLRMVGRLVWCSMGRPSVSPFPKLERDNRPWRSSLSKGCCERPSVGRCNGGRLTTISSSESWESCAESWTVSALEITRGSESSKVSEATVSLVGESLIVLIIAWNPPWSGGFLSDLLSLGEITDKRPRSRGEQMRWLNHSI